MVSKQQQTQIDRLMRLRQTAMATIFAQAAREMSMVASKEVLVGLAKTGYTVASAEGITDKIVADYTRNILNGGTDCIERVLTPVKGGMYKATTRQTFVPWLADMSVRDTSNIITLIGDAEQAGVHPRQIAKELEAYFEGTKHNAMTAARTEASKIRNDARSASFEESGVKYVEYVTAGDELVRPEHAMRNGKIYEHQNAPFVGEYNCRCLLVPADYKVNRKGAEVTKSDAEYLSQEQTKPTKSAITKPAAKDYVKFTSKREAEAYAKALIPNADYKGLNLQAANILSESLNYHARLNPKLIKECHNFGSYRGFKNGITKQLEDVIPESIPGAQTKKEIVETISSRFSFVGEEKAYAAAIKNIESYKDINVMTRGIGANPIPLNNANLVSNLKRGIEAKYHPVGTENPVSVINHEWGHVLNDVFKLEKRDDVLKIIAETEKLPGGVADNLCIYAKKDTSEFISEAWAEYTTSPNPRPVSVKIGKIIMKEVEKY